MILGEDRRHEYRNRGPGATRDASRRLDLLRRRSYCSQQAWSSPRSLGGGANITAGVLGMGFGILGYFLGARKLATATVFLCAAAILFGLAASQGLCKLVSTLRLRRRLSARRLRRLVSKSARTRARQS